MAISATATPAAGARTFLFGWWSSRPMRRLRKRPDAMIAGAFILAFVLIAIFAPLIAPYDPVAANFLAVRKPPSAAYWLGTDEVGRDLLSRLIWGARSSLSAGVIPVCIAISISIPFGILAGYAGGIVDTVIMRLTDALLAIPFLIIAIALAAFLGPSLFNAMIAIGVAALPLFLRLSRGAVMAVKNEDYIEAARALGNVPIKIAYKHILPNMLPPMMIQASITVAMAIIAEASLSFLGLGQQPPDPSWGSMLNAAQRYMSTAPWIAIWPGVAIFCVVLALNVFSDGLRESLDPRQK